MLVVNDFPITYCTVQSVTDKPGLLSLCHNVLPPTQTLSRLTPTRQRHVWQLNDCFRLAILKDMYSFENLGERTPTSVPL